MRRCFFLLIFLFAGSSTGWAQALTAETLLNKSIAYHDPDQQWFQGHLR